MPQIRAFIALSFFLSGSFVSASGIMEQSGVEVPLNMEDAPLEEVLSAMAAMEGTELVLKGDVAAHRVSVVLERGDFEKNLEGVMRGLDYVSVWGPDKKLTVWVFNTEKEDVGSYREVEDLPASLPITPDSSIWIPSGGDGDRGYTEADVAHYRSRQIPVDPAASYVVPPDESGQEAPTQVEVEKITAARKPLAPDSLVLPPAFPGEDGVTIEELKRLRDHYDDYPKQAGYQDVVPPD